MFGLVGIDPKSVLKYPAAQINGTDKKKGNNLEIMPP